MRLLLSPVPYVGVFLGLCFLLAAAGASKEDPPQSPVEMSMSELERKSPADLPDRIRVNDGVPHWIESSAIYEQREGVVIGDEEKYVKLLVPLLSQETLTSWPDVPANIKTGYILELSWDELEEQFPDIARAHEDEAAAEDINIERLSEAFDVSFKPVKSDVWYNARTDGPETQAVTELKGLGIQDVVVVRPGTQPLGHLSATSDDSAGTAIMGLVFVVGCGWWIRRRRKRAKADNVIGGLVAAAERGFQQAHR